MNTVFLVLSVQIVLGAFDNLWHHEITERLPSKRGARHELALHAAREFLYAVIFLGFAWYEWRGAWAWAAGAAAGHRDLRHHHRLSGGRSHPQAAGVGALPTYGTGYQLRGVHYLVDPNCVAMVVEFRPRWRRSTTDRGRGS